MASKGFHDKSANNLIKDPLYVISHFSLAVAFWQFDYDVCLCVDLFKFIPFGIIWTLWMFIFTCFITFSKFWAIISSNNCYASFLLLLEVRKCLRSFSSVSPRSLRSAYPSSFLFISFCPLENFNSPVWSLIISSTYSKNFEPF